MDILDETPAARTRMPRPSVAGLARQRFQAKRLLEEFSNSHRVAVRELIGRCNIQRLVDMRAAFMRLAHSQGIGPAAISSAIKRHVDTVCYHTGGRKGRKNRRRIERLREKEMMNARRRECEAGQAAAPAGH